MKRSIRVVAGLVLAMFVFSTCSCALMMPRPPSPSLGEAVQQTGRDHVLVFDPIWPALNWLYLESSTEWLGCLDAEMSNDTVYLSSVSLAPPTAPPTSWGVYARCPDDSFATIHPHFGMDALPEEACGPSEQDMKTYNTHYRKHATIMVMCGPSHAWVSTDRVNFIH